jgi:hypothetical protein
MVQGQDGFVIVFEQVFGADDVLGDKAVAVSVIIDIVGLWAIEDMVFEVGFAILAPVVNESDFFGELSFQLTGAELAINHAKAFSFFIRSTTLRKSSKVCSLMVSIW